MKESNKTWIEDEFNFRIHLDYYIYTRVLRVFSMVIILNIDIILIMVNLDW